MLPVVTPEAMQAIDASATESVAVLIQRAGWAVARSARTMMAGTYGRRVAVLCGKGNNGADGRVAASILSRWGAVVEVVEVDGVGWAEPILKGFDLVIDAAFGTGFRGTFSAPEVGTTPVLAVDIPSGVDGLTGQVGGRPLCATRTVCFVAPKPGLLMLPGAGFVGEIEVVDIGLDPYPARRWWMEPSDLGDYWPRRGADDHKWASAVWVIGGGPGFSGAPSLAVAGAARAGAGYVMLSIPGSDEQVGPTEVVQRSLGSSWAATVLADAHRIGCLVIGPGLPTSLAAEVQELVSTWRGPLVLDAGALDAVAGVPEVLDHRPTPAILTPHAGEFRRLGGHLGDDPIASVEDLARRLGSVVLLKGPTTIVADPAGSTWLSTAGDARLATAGTGDVLAGMIGAAVALGTTPGLAAALSAQLHGMAATNGFEVGFVAGDLPELVAEVLTRSIDDAS